VIDTDIFNPTNIDFCTLVGRPLAAGFETAQALLAPSDKEGHSRPSVPFP
jgi:hypothetical protein